MIRFVVDDQRNPYLSAFASARFLRLAALDLSALRALPVIFAIERKTLNRAIARF